MLAEKIARIAAPELGNAYLYRRAQEAIRARDRVLGIVAHALRNPFYPDADAAIEDRDEAVMTPTC